jgi:hypothetical protein
MKRLVLATLIATLVGSSSGCCLFDRLFGCHQGYPVGQRPQCCNNGCNTGACNSGGCNKPGCAACANNGVYGQGPGSQLVGGAGKHAPVPNDGPSTGAVAYPYYTTRGPRDFLSANPGSIGP